MSLKRKGKHMRKIKNKMFLLGVTFLSLQLLSCSPVNTQSSSNSINNSSSSSSISESLSEEEKTCIVSSFRLSTKDNQKKSSINGSIQFTITIKFDESSQITIITPDMIKFNYNEEKARIYFPSDNSTAIGNAFIFIIKSFTSDTVPVSVKIQNVVNSYIFDFTATALSSSLLYYQANTPLGDGETRSLVINSYSEYNDLLKRLNKTTFGKNINEEYFNKYKIIAMEVGTTSSVKSLEYRSSFIDGESVSCEFVCDMPDETSWDYIPNIYIIEVATTLPIASVNYVEISL